MQPLNFVQDISYHKRIPRDDLIHHLLGNGHLQAMVQVTENRTSRNALVLHMMNPDRFENRPKSSSFTFHQQAGPELTLVALYTQNKLYVPHPRQTAFDLQYQMDYSDNVPTFRATYPVDFTIAGDRKKSAFNVEEQLFCPLGHAAVLRRVRVTNQRGLEEERARLFAFLVPNQSLFPEAHYLTENGVAVAGHFERGDEFLGLSAVNQIVDHQVAEFPVPLDDAYNGELGDLASSYDNEKFVRSQETYTNYPLLPGSAHLGPVLALGFDLGAFPPGQSHHIDLIYAYGESEQSVIETVEALREKGWEQARKEVQGYWGSKNDIESGDEALDEFYRAVRAGIYASAAKSGRMDAAIWGYNAEWVRDSSCASLGLIHSGQFERARAVLSHILNDLISPDGMAYGESQFYEPRRAELDQNGEFLHALWQYWVHSRDDSLIREHWDKIAAIAEFPIGPHFWVEEASMVKSERDQRDRDAERHGLKEGFELAHQMWVSLGLNKAADMAAIMENKMLAAKWRGIGERIWHAVLNHPRFNLVENGHLMKRRLPDGSFQRFAKVIPYVHRIDEKTTKVYPRNRHRDGELEPDGSEAWPIAHGMIDPESELAHRTLLRMESLWNFEWDFGGYPLHHPGSEPTKLGSWPMIFYFVTQAALEAREYDTVRRNLRWILSTKDGRGYTWWEYRDADPELQIDHGIAPWFGYGEPVFMFVHHLLGYRPGPESITLNPHLLPELKEVSAHMRCGPHWVNLRYHNNGQRIQKVEVNGKNWTRFTSESVTIEIPSSDVIVETWSQAD